MLQGAECSVWQHEDVFAGTQPEFDDVLVHDLHVATCGNSLTIDMRTIRALQVDKIGLDLANSIAEFVPFLDIAELKCGVLLRTAWVFEGKVDHTILTTDQPAAAFTKLHHF